MKKEKILLIVEDERPLLEAIKKKFEDQHFSTVTARSVDQAMNYINEIEGISGIWLDHYLLGEKDGIDLIEDLKRKSSKFDDIPIFVVSNTASSDKVRLYKDLDVVEYYVKADHKLEEIVNDIKDHLKK